MIWDVIDLIARGLFLLSVVASVVFVVLYGARSSWRATRAGRAIMGFMTILAFIMLLTVIFGILLEGISRPVESVVRLVTFSALFAGLVRLIIVLLRSQREEVRKNGTREEPSS